MPARVKPSSGSTARNENVDFGVIHAMKLRSYPSAGQNRRLGRWLWIAHRFRNEAVAFLEQRRRERFAWIRQHPALSKGWIPNELAGNDAAACSRWLTGRLERARETVRLEGGVTASKADMTTAVGQTMNALSRGERDVLQDAWLLCVPRTVLDQIVQDMGKTLSRAIGDRVAAKAKAGSGAGANASRLGRHNRTAGFPRFHKWSYAGSVRLQVEAGKNRSFRENWAQGEVFIPGLGRLRFRDSGYTLPPTPPKLITVTRNAAGHTHVAFVCTEGESGKGRDVACGNSQARPLPIDETTGLPMCIGLDLGLTSLVTTSKGLKIKPNRHLKHYLSKQRRLNKRLGRQKKGSRRYGKTRQDLGRLHVRITHCREADHRVAVKTVVNPAAIVCMESLRLAFMTQNRHLSRSAHGAALGRLTAMIRHECEKQGKLFLQCDRFDPSTQACSACGEINHLLRNNLKLRTWTCPVCETTHDRDINAAVNIIRMALRKATTDFSTVPGIGTGKRRLHQELEAFIARGGMTALLEAHATRIRRGQATPAACQPLKRALPQPVTVCQEQAGMG